jgi:hypothetical protein
MLVRQTCRVPSSGCCFGILIDSLQDSRLGRFMVPPDHQVRSPLRLIQDGVRGMVLYQPCVEGSAILLYGD